MTAFSSLYGERLSRELGTDDSTVLFTSARRKAAINEGALEFADITECLERTSTITIVGGTQEYAVTVDPSSIVGDFLRYAKRPVQFQYTDAAGVVTVLEGDDLPRRDPHWLARYAPGWNTSTTASTTRQTPSYYYDRVDGGRRVIGFAPKPCTGSSASAIALVPYIALPPPMTSDTQEPFQVVASTNVSTNFTAVAGVQRTDLRPFHQALVHYAAAQLEKFRKDTAASDRQMKQFYDYIQRYWQTMRTKSGTSLTFARTYFTRGRSS